jgi:prophage regulatory protein
MHASTHQPAPAILLELLSRGDLRALGIKASNPTLLIWEAEGNFPCRIRITSAKVAWLRHEIVAWIEAKAAARNSRIQIPR